MELSLSVVLRIPAHPCLEAQGRYISDVQYGLIICLHEQLELYVDKPRRKASSSLRANLHRFRYVIYPEPLGRRERVPHQIELVDSSTGSSIFNV